MERDLIVDIISVYGLCRFGRFGWSVNFRVWNKHENCEKNEHYLSPYTFRILKYICLMVSQFLPLSEMPCFSMKA